MVEAMWGQDDLLVILPRIKVQEALIFLGISCSKGYRYTSGFCRSRYRRCFSLLLACFAAAPHSAQ